jgi:hypothetical protein
MALAAIADDADLLALDQVQVGVAIVINSHGYFLSSATIFQSCPFERVTTAWWMTMNCRRFLGRRVPRDKPATVILRCASGS